MKNNKYSTYTWLPSGAKPLNSYKYSIEVYCIADGKRIKLTPELVDFTVEHYYVENLMPIITLDFLLKRTTLITIQENANNVIFLLSLNRFSVDSEKTEVETFGSEIVFKDLPMVPIDLNLEKPPESNEADSNDFEGGESSNQFEYKVNLLSEDILNKNRQIKDLVLNDAEVIDPILYLMYAYNFRDNSMLVSEPDNRDKYNQIIIPPYNFHNTCDYLQKYYGIFKYGMLLYIDFSIGYLLSNDIINNSPTKPNEHKLFFIEFVDTVDQGPDSLVSRYADDIKNKRYYVRMVDNIRFSNTQKSNKELIGDTVKVVSRKKEKNVINNWKTEDVTTKFKNDKLTIESKIVSQSKVNLFDSDKSRKEKIVYDGTSNPFTIPEFLFSSSKSTVQAMLEIKDINIDYFTPNRLFYFKFSNTKRDKDHGGYYQLTKFVYKLDPKGNGKSNTISGICIFHKIYDVMDND